MVDQVIAKIPTILAVGVLARTAQRVTAGQGQKAKVRPQGRRPLGRIEGTLPRMSSARLASLKRIKALRENFLDIWYDLDRPSFNRLLKRNNQDGKKMVDDFARENLEVFNHIWDVSILIWDRRKSQR